jgi:hypothetical protein
VSALPDGFGRDYRRAVIVKVTTKRAVALAWVLVDAAYAYRSLTFELGYRLLGHETGLARWDLPRARDDLVEAGLLSVASRGQGRAARTHWTLVNVRPRPDVPGGDKRPVERPAERPPTTGHESESEFKYFLLNPPSEEGGLPDDLLKRVVETVGAVATAREAHDRLQEVFEANGLRCEREVVVDDRGDGRRGRLDLVVYDDAGHATAIELDFQAPRRKSLAKLRSFRGGRVVVLREGPPPPPPDGIDAVYSLNPAQPREGRDRRTTEQFLADALARAKARDAEANQ